MSPDIPITTAEQVDARMITTQLRLALYAMTMYHNTESRFFPYQDGEALVPVISHWRRLPIGTAAELVADWAYHVFNADLDTLESGRGTPDGEADFLLACVYRLMRHRSMSAGDVIAVTADGHTTWLACEFIGWRRIGRPAAALTAEPLTAETVYRYISGGRDA